MTEHVDVCVCVCVCVCQVSPGSHSSEHAVNKQLSDKERVAAALENPNLLDMVNRCVCVCVCARARASCGTERQH